MLNNFKQLEDIGNIKIGNIFVIHSDFSKHFVKIVKIEDNHVALAMSDINYTVWITFESLLTSYTYDPVATTLYSNTERY